MVRPVHDTRREPVGGFTEPVAPGDLVRVTRTGGASAVAAAAALLKMPITNVEVGSPTRTGWWSCPQAHNQRPRAPTPAPNNQPQGSAGTVR